MFPRDFFYSTSAAQRHSALVNVPLISRRRPFLCRPVLAPLLQQRRKPPVSHRVSRSSADFTAPALSIRLTPRFILQKFKYSACRRHGVRKRRSDHPRRRTIRKLRRLYTDGAPYSKSLSALTADSARARTKECRCKDTIGKLLTNGRLPTCRNERR